MTPTDRKAHNVLKTCWNCPSINLAGKVDFRACGQAAEGFDKDTSAGDQLMAECKRRPGLGLFDPMAITFEECPEWLEGPYGFMLKDMRVMILGIDGYLGWTLALKLGRLGYRVSGVDNYSRRSWLAERGGHTIVPIARMTDRLHAASEVLGVNINFRAIDVYRERERLREYLDEVKPEAIIHYAECPSAPFSMIDLDHASFVQENNVLGTLGVLFMMRDILPETSLVKLGTMGEYGAPLTGRPIFEGVFPADAVLHWDDRQWSLGGEMTPRDPVSFYHVSKVQDTFNVYEACKYWWLRSYDIMQGIIYGVHTDEVSADPRLRTRLDVDEWFGTVINRFVSQAVIGYPLTVYGSGEQTRAFIALEDAMQCMVRLINSPPEPGQYGVVNQMSGYYSVMDLAKTIGRVASQEFGLRVTIQRLENPRVEADRHPFEPVFDTLPDEFGFQAQHAPEDVVYEMLKLLTEPKIRARILEKKHLICPSTWWSGAKKQARRLEVLEETTYG